MINFTYYDTKNEYQKQNCDGIKFPSYMSTVFSCKETRVSWKHGCWYPDLLISISAGILLRDKKTILLGVPTFETF